MDGLNLKFAGSVLDTEFEVDAYGSIIPKTDNLRLERVCKKLAKQLSTDSGLYRRMTRLYYNTDVEFTNNPYGNTPVISFGVRDYGKRPLDKMSAQGKVEAISKKNPEKEKELAKRERRIEKYQSDVLALHESLKPDEADHLSYLLWQVEGDQAMTGGGFDGNAIGEVQKSALKFVTKSTNPIAYKDSVLSKLVVESSLELRDYLKQCGMEEGSLKPIGASVVRFLQDNDGLIGYPVYSKGNSALDNDVALRLLLESGVDTRRFVGSTITDVSTSEQKPYRVIDAIGYILDHKVFSSSDIDSVVTLLARIQKHGWKHDDKGFVAKPGKTRSVYPNAAIPGVIEAMIFQPFLAKLQELKVSIMPSLQDKPTRVQMITELIKEAFSKEYDFLAADWSQYDATIKGAILATIINLAVKPFFNSSYYSWVEHAIYILTYKYIVCDTSLCKINPKEFDEAKQSTVWQEEGPFTIFGLVDGLISGAKFTHVGGSFYGEVVIHRVIPKLLGYQPMFGPQAGDDTLLAIPRNLIDTSSVENTYNPIADVAKTVGLDINPSKQIWHQYDGEVVKVFLQEVYQYNLDIFGTGSIFRPYDALPFSEKQKGLSPAEQEMACISRMNQGYDNPFCNAVIEDWLKRDQFLGVLFKDYGTSAFDKIVQATGLDVESLIQRIGVGSFTFGIARDDIRSGNIPILKNMADVASKMSFSVAVDQALKSINPEDLGVQENSLELEPSIGDDDDVLAD